MRPNVTPSTGKRDTKNNSPFVFEQFARGIIQDAPASEISNALANGSNVTVFPGYWEGRLGCKKYTSEKFPFITGRTGYSAHKSGDNIISDSGDIFTPADVGNFFCWGSVYEFIVEFIDVRTVKVEKKDYQAGISCSIQGGINVFDWHKTLQQFILQLGTDCYSADPEISGWTKALTISRDILFNTISDYSEFQHHYYFFNGNGLFKVDSDATFPIAYKVNLAPPNIRIESIPSFVGALCRYRYLYSAARLESEEIIVDRQTPSVISCETGTCTPDQDNIDYAEVFKGDEITPLSPQLVKELWVPIVKNTNPQEYQWHLTHFPIYRSFDLEAKDVSDVNKEKYNDPQRFIWAKDLRICGAFYVTKDGEFIDAIYGEFEVADTHSILELDNGERIEILEWISKTRVRVANDYYYGNDHDGPYAAAIGNGRVFRGSMAGDILTRTHGAAFTAADVRKTMTNSFGYRLYITEFISANQVRVHRDWDMPVQGFTCDPTHRKFYDTITDEILRARKDFYSCYGRYRQELPNCNVGIIVPGFVIAAFRGQKTIFYSGLVPERDYMVGQYIPIQIIEDVQDAIQKFWLFADIIATWCASSTYGIVQGLSEFKTLPESAEAIAILPGLKLVDKHIGCLDVGSIKEVESGVVQLVTNEPGGEAGRKFNGSSYSTENFLVDDEFGGRIVRTLERTKKMSAAIYDGLMGYIFWRKNK